MTPTPTPQDALDARLQEIGGCTDGNCIIWKPKGMHTNGGCRCSRDPYKMQQVIHAYKAALSSTPRGTQAEEDKSVFSTTPSPNKATLTECVFSSTSPDSTKLLAQARELKAIAEKRLENLGWSGVLGPFDEDREKFLDDCVFYRLIIALCEKIEERLK